ncbi:hypothetical protein VIGAN_03290900 [Vigna angularis var. angularis]|uniref:Uncharacterized protein n=1 Tax=Vigna angularis var. angularis TaxID=157739 RepID=A0A0S3RQK9_PHAAN|nr:hypothetical protein VIGAN_03290900 [Vigna angularis var. angularis]
MLIDKISMVYIFTKFVLGKFYGRVLEIFFWKQRDFKKEEDRVYIICTAILAKEENNFKSKDERCNMAVQVFWIKISK